MDVTAPLPASAPERDRLQGELLARPPARIRLPALVVYVAVDNTGISIREELSHLQALAQDRTLTESDLAQHFLRLRLAASGSCGSLKWERHAEFTRYSFTLPWQEDVSEEPQLPPLIEQWIAGIPGQVLVAIQLAMLQLTKDTNLAVGMAERWLGSTVLIASQLGAQRHSQVFCDPRIRPSGFERMMLLTDGIDAVFRNGRMAQRLLEFQTYRVMALRGLPVAQQLIPRLKGLEQELAALTERLREGAQGEDQLDQLIALAAKVENMTAEHGYRFAATRAYHGILQQRLAELNESALPGMQTLGGFTLRRLTPAVATVTSTQERLAALSQRIERCGALLRTRVDIAAEARQQQLLSQLAAGQRLQLNLQTTVEGLSIAAISYYVISLMSYGLKAAKSAGLPVDTDVVTGLLIPLVMGTVWLGTRRIHARFSQTPH